MMTCMREPSSKITNWHTRKKFTLNIVAIENEALGEEQTPWPYFSIQLAFCEKNFAG